ncbi:MAG TPA: type II secretion system major pseudopilin GspG [Tahibacter sp.]|nr:type II secretion system major pseudopilin GspG [Tahibacter sp.]
MRLIHAKRGVRRAAGFSLLEMLAVIVLIGIVAGIVVSKIGPTYDRGRWNAGKAQLGKLEGAIERYALDNGAPPQRLDDLVEKPANAKSWKAAYVKKSDLVDPFGHAFAYRAPGERGDFDLAFLGKDGKSGGDAFDADVGNWE